MPAKSAAERMRLYRQRMSEEKRLAVKERNKEEQKKCRSHWSASKRKEESIKSTKRKSDCREREKLKKALKLPVHVSPAKAFGSSQSCTNVNDTFDCMTMACGQLEMSVKPETDTDEEPGLPWGLQRHCSGTSDCSERSVRSSAASESETDYQSPPAAVMGLDNQPSIVPAIKVEPDSQPASLPTIKVEPHSQPGSVQTIKVEPHSQLGSVGTIEVEPDSQPASLPTIKVEPVDDGYSGTGDAFHQFHADDNREGGVDFKCDFTYEPGSSADMCPSQVDQGDSQVDQGDSDETEREMTDRKDMEKNRRKYVCDVCFKDFTMSSNLKQHKLIHSGQKPFVCDVCNRAFSQAGNLKKHKLIHAGLKQYICDVCNKAFTDASNLKGHILIHTSAKVFVCDVCCKAFSQAGYLRKHKLTHTRLKQIECDICLKAFTTAGELKQHKLIHSDHKQFVCDVCDKAFTWSGNLKRHKATHIEERAESSLESESTLSR